MSDNEEHSNLYFHVEQYRKIFKKISIIYIILIILLALVFYRVSSRPDLVYFASNESGVLKRLTIYTEQQADEYIAANNRPA